ncbi:MAG: undecaprenyl-diphosphate phosphatase [Planctomycetes bacterium]|nr:undecaprenyl-diphosphate phosphatase [Planctomycetota bacterium]
MPYGDEMLLGAIQGLTEFLPVSSSGHLQAGERWLDSPLARDLSFDVFVHLATLVAVLWVFRRDFALLVRSVFEPGSEHRRLLGSVIVGAVPAGIVGLLLKDVIESLPSRWPYLVAVCWLVTAASLYSLRFGHRETRPSVTLPAALWIGAFQAVALLPGISRSGITICAALWIGCRREDAARFSFLCATPLIAGAAGLELFEVYRAGGPPAGATWTGYLIGGGVALITGYIALTILLRMLKAGALHYWAYYLVVVAGVYSGWLAAH